MPRGAGGKRTESELFLIQVKVKRGGGGEGGITEAKYSAGGVFGDKGGVPGAAGLSPYLSSLALRQNHIISGLKTQD